MAPTVSERSRARIDGGRPARPPSRWEAPMFRKLGSWCHDHRRAGRRAVGRRAPRHRAPQPHRRLQLHRPLSLPSSESAKGFDLLDRSSAGVGLSSSATLVFSTDAGVTDPTVQAEMEDYFDRITAETGVQVVSPYGPQGATQISASGDRAGQGRLRPARDPRLAPWASSATSVPRSRTSPPPSTGSASSSAATSSPSSSPRPPRSLGLAFAIVILILAFGSVLAMGLPIGVALAGIGIGIGARRAAQPRDADARLRHHPRR